MTTSEWIIADYSMVFPVPAFSLLSLSIIIIKHIFVYQLLSISIIISMLKLSPGMKQGSCSTPIERVAWADLECWIFPIVTHWSQGWGWYSRTSPPSFRLSINLILPPIIEAWAFIPFGKEARKVQAVAPVRSVTTEERKFIVLLPPATRKPCTVHRWYSCTDPNWCDSPLELSNSPLPLRHSRLHPIYISRGQTRITYISVEKPLKYGQ